MDFSKPDNARTINRLKVLSELRKGRCSKAELSRRLGINKVSIGEITASLMKEGLITEGEKDFSSAGRPGTLLSVAKDAGRVFAFVVRKRSVSVAVSDLLGRILRFERIPRAGGSCREGIEAAVERMKGDGRCIYGSAVVSDGDEEIDGMVLSPILHLPPAVAEACAEEARHGKLEGMLFLSWSYALDAAVRKGELIHLPELPHIRAQKDGLCPCGGKGCLEAAIGGDAMVSRTGAPSLKEIARNGIYRDALSEALKPLSFALASAMQALSLEGMMITGDMSAMPDWAYAQLQSLVMHLLPPSRQDTAIFRATAGDKGAMEGAAAAALDAFFYQRPLLDRLEAIENLSSRIPT